LNYEEQKRNRYQQEAERVEWLHGVITQTIPDWLESRKSFEYNDLYDFWRLSYWQKSRQMIRDYETLLAVSLPAPYQWIIDHHSICVQAPHPHTHNRYQGLLVNVPMDSPIEPEAIWDSNWNNHYVDLHDCSFSNIMKTHVFHSYHRAPMLRLEVFMNGWLGPLGYSMRMFLKGSGNGTEYSLGITHETETPDAFIEALELGGYKPFDDKNRALKAVKPSKTAVKAPAQAESEEDLKKQEAELLLSLEKIRQRLGHLDGA
jgi:hypothetical protein